MGIRSLVIGLVLALATSCSPSATPTSPGGRALAVSSNPRTDLPANQVDVTSGFVLAGQAGVHADFISRTWSKTNPQPGVFAFDDLHSYFAFAKSRFSSILLGIQVLNTTAKETPADLSATAFDSPNMESRFHIFLDALKPLLIDNANHIVYLSIGNEVDIYLAAHPSEWGAYTAFYNDAVSYVHSIAPAIKVGVTTTFAGHARSGGPIDALNDHSDIVINTYYPISSSFHALASDSPLHDIPAMVGSANKRPLVLQEVGYPSAPSLSSSENAQADFFRNVFKAWDLAGSAIPFLNVFLLHDFTPAFCQQLAGYYGVTGPGFSNYLCSLGVRHGDDSAKPSWAVFAAEAAALK